MSDQPGVPHSGAGAALALERFGTSIAGGMIASVIEAHHGALKSPSEMFSAVSLRGRKLLAAAREGGFPAELEIQHAGSPSSVSALSTRMLFSALVDADLLDTEAWATGTIRQTSRATMAAMRDQLDATCQAMIQAAATRGGTEKERRLSAMRALVYRNCVARSQERSGHFTLTVPTGGGKTLSGLAFALHHAARYGKQRVIVVAPFTSILEQTADVYRKIFGLENVVEHHSNLEPAIDTNRNQQACENWDAPLVVTTSVQLLESLHAAHKRACRKLHRIAESVLLLDEVQTFPIDLLRPIHAMLVQLVDQFGVTVIHGTATQPLMARPPKSRTRNAPAEFSVTKTEIMDDPPALFSAVRDRFRIETLGDLNQPLSPAALVADVLQQQSALVVTHRRRDARRLAEMMGDRCLHLSAAMCAAHRSDVLRQARQMLKGVVPCKIVATQLVEAGVDIDFPVVYRALAGLETLAQAAGRCNRGMSLPAPGRFVVYRAGEQEGEAGPVRESKPPVGTPRLGMEIAWNEYFRHALPDLHDPNLFPAYTSKVIDLRDTDGRAILQAEAALDFPQVSEKFSMVEEKRISVVAPYKDGSRLLEELRMTGPTRIGFRALQRYVVGVSEPVFEAMFRSGWLEPVFDSAARAENLWAVRSDDVSPYDSRFGFPGQESEIQLRSLQV